MSEKKAEEVCIQKLKTLFEGMREESEKNTPKRRNKTPSIAIGSKLSSKSQAMRSKLPHVLLNLESTADALHPTDQELRFSAQYLCSASKLYELYFKQLEDDSDPRVKLILSSVFSSKKKKCSIICQFKNYAAKLMDMKLGAVHTALQIGPVVLEWNNTSLVVPFDSASYFNRTALCSIDVDFEDVHNKFPISKVKTLSQLVAEWNSSKTYDVQKTNCQVFTDTLFEAIGLSKFGKEINHFLKNLYELDVESKDMQISHTFVGDKSPTIFTSHKELDELKKLKPDSIDYKICKAYDRMFWLRYYGVQKSTHLPMVERIQLLGKYNCSATLKCYFQDPKETKTLYGMKKGSEEKEGESSDESEDEDSEEAD